MALNFPDSPTLNQVYTDTTSGFSYQWDGVVWQSYSPAESKNIRVVDDISGSFNGSTQTFALAVSGVSLTPANAQQLRVVLGGIVQEPGTDYTVLGSDITFTSAPNFGLDCSIVSLGPAVPVNTIIDGTVTPAKLSTGGPSWNTDGDLYIAGITTITNASGTVIAGIGTTALIVEGNARVTGILTVGPASVTIDGVNNEIKIGTGLTISSSGITGTASTVTSAAVSYGLEGTPNITVGFITATGASISGNVSIAGTLTYEDVTNVDSVGLITARSGINVSGGSLVIDSGGINVSGVVTATSFVGDGSGLTSLDAADISSGTLAIARGGTNSTATATAGGAAYGTGSAFAFTSAGTSGQVLTSNGTSAPTWADAGGGAWQFISSVTASNSASVAFTSGIDSTYDNYVIIGSNIITSVDASISARVSNNGGSSYSTSNYGSGVYDLIHDSPFNTSAGSGSWSITPRFIESTGVGAFIYLYLFAPSTSGAYHMASNRTYYQYNGASPFTGRDVMFGYSDTTTYNAIQFYPSSGNIASGTFRLYGINNS